MLTQLKDKWRYRKVPHHLKPILDKLIKLDCSQIGFVLPDQDATGIIIGYGPQYLLVAVEGTVRHVAWANVKTTPQWRLAAHTMLHLWENGIERGRTLALQLMVQMAWGDRRYKIEGVPRWDIPVSLFCERSLSSQHDTRFKRSFPHLRLLWCLIDFRLNTTTVWFAHQIHIDDSEAP